MDSLFEKENLRYEPVPIQTVEGPARPQTRPFPYEMEIMSGPPGQTFHLAAAVGLKHDTGKLRVDLLPVDVLEGVAAVLTHGCNKYGARNWEKGINQSRLYGATLRHLFAHWQGEDKDAETGLPHLDHALCELMFLCAMAKRAGMQPFDDRPISEKKA